MKKYFHRIGNRSHVFSVLSAEQSVKKSEKKWIGLVSAGNIPIQRHVKVQSEANPFDPEWETYFEERLFTKMKRDPKGGATIQRVWLRQKGICPACRQMLKEAEDWNLHHILPKHDGGNDKISNLTLLHANCHRQVHIRSVLDRDAGLTLVEAS